MTIGRHTRRKVDPAKAFAMTSGPIPAGSPIVIPSSGRVTRPGLFGLFRLFGLFCGVFTELSLPASLQPDEQNKPKETDEPLT